jgi:hypothetical protein
VKSLTSRSKKRQNFAIFTGDLIPFTQTNEEALLVFKKSWRFSTPAKKIKKVQESFSLIFYRQSDDFRTLHWKKLKGMFKYFL